MEVVIIVLSILMISSLVRSTFGFGDALISMPLLTLVIGIKTASPLVALISLANASAIVASSWRFIDLRSAIKLLIGSMIGIPLGMFFLIHSPEQVIKTFLGIILILFALYRFLNPKLPLLSNDKWGYLFGFVAGLLGGAYNTNGPPAVIYGTLRQWSPGNFRSTLQGFLLPANCMIVFGHGLGGLWNAQVFNLFLAGVPIVLFGTMFGNYIIRKLAPHKFTNTLHSILLLLGIFMVYNANI
jgi:hypothetical protein